MTNAGSAADRETFDTLLVELRPKLHRYCARLTGSVIDGEDVVQDAVVKAIEAFATATPIENPEGWLFRIAHNAALDFLRRRARLDATASDEALEMIADPEDTTRDRQIAASSLRLFMQLPVAHRSSVILMDVLGYSLREISGIMDVSIPAVKAALHRGRARLRDAADKADDHPLPVLSEPVRSLLAEYVDRFNARDFDAIRNMLADEVRLDLVAKTRLSGRTAVGGYLHNYAHHDDWQFAMGLVESRPAVLVSDPRDASPTPSYFVLLEWQGDRVLTIRDFRYARYAIDSADLVIGFS